MGPVALLLYKKSKVSFGNGCISKDFESLTGNVGRIVKSLGDFGVKIYEQIVLAGYSLVSTLDFFLYPVRKIHAHQSVHDINNPLSREFLPVSFIRQELFYLWILCRFFEDSADAQRFVLWNEQVVDLVTLND